MKKIDFIMQGISNEAHSEKIFDMFSGNFDIMIVCVAFLSQKGVKILKKCISNCSKEKYIIVGIDNGVTTYEGLLDLIDCCKNIYLVCTGSNNIIFHPKIYYTRNEKKISAIIGSANMTLGGMSSNIEASVYLNVYSEDEDYSYIKKRIEEYVYSLIGNYKDNVFLVSSKEDLANIYEKGLLEINKKNPQRECGDVKKQIKRMRLNVCKLKHIDKSNTMTDEKRDYYEVWTSTPLTERDLNIPRGSNTHITGSINLDKGTLKENVDHRTYFKECVFNELDWTPKKNSSIVEADAEFILEIMNKRYGSFTLKIRHTTDKKLKTYKQNNAMTRLSWGKEAKQYIANRELLGKKLILLKSKMDKRRFKIIIK